MAIELFGKKLGLLEKSLELREQRNAMIASNVANRETPGFRAKDLVFEKELSQAYHSDQPGPLETSDSRHFDGINRKRFESVSGLQIQSIIPIPGWTEIP